jgi:hypothetical protein
MPVTSGRASGDDHDSNKIAKQKDACLFKIAHFACIAGTDWAKPEPPLPRKDGTGIVMASSTVSWALEGLVRVL